MCLWGVRGQLQMVLLRWFLTYLGLHQIKQPVSYLACEIPRIYLCFQSGPCQESRQVVLGLAFDMGLSSQLRP